MMHIPRTPPDEQMASELAEWNNGHGIDLESWISCMGNFSLAVGYAEIFWPEFELYDGYVLRKGFDPDNLRAFEAQPGLDRASIEIVMNHIHIADFHYGADDISAGKLIRLGEILQQIYQVKLASAFPDREFIVTFLQPEDPEDYINYESHYRQK